MPHDKENKHSKRDKDSNRSNRGGERFGDRAKQNSWRDKKRGNSGDYNSNNRNKNRYSDKENFADIDGEYLIYGKHPCIAALLNKKRNIKKVFVTQNALSYIQEKLTPEAFSKLNYEISEAKKLDRMLQSNQSGQKYNSQDIVHQGIVISTERLPELNLKAALDDFSAQDILGDRLVLLDGVTDINNIGAIIRSGRAFGFCDIIGGLRDFPPETASILKTSTGLFEEVNYFRVKNMAEIMQALKELGYKFVALDASNANSVSLDSPSLEINSDKIVIVMGAEGRGLRDSVSKMCDIYCKIDMIAGVDSLNVSVAFAITAHKFRNCKV